MIASLVLTDLFRSAKRFAVGLPMLVLVAPVVDLVMGAEVASGMVPAFFTLLAWDHLQQTALTEDKEQTWEFLRVLPLSPVTIVTVRFLSNGAAILMYALVGTLTAISIPLVRQAVSPGDWPIFIAFTVAVSLLMMAWFNARYYRAGYRGVMTNGAVTYVILLVVGVAVLMARTPVIPVIRAVTTAYHWAQAQPAPALTAIVASTLVLVVLSWGYSVTVFSRKEFH